MKAKVIYLVAMCLWLGSSALQAEDLAVEGKLTTVELLPARDEDRGTLAFSLDADGLETKLEIVLYKKITGKGVVATEADFVQAFWILRSLQGRDVELVVDRINRGMDQASRVARIIRFYSKSEEGIEEFNFSSLDDVMEKYELAAPEETPADLEKVLEYLASTKAKVIAVANEAHLLLPTEAQKHHLIRISTLAEELIQNSSADCLSLLK